MKTRAARVFGLRLGRNRCNNRSMKARKHKKGLDQSRTTDQIPKSNTWVGIKIESSVLDVIGSKPKGGNSCYHCCSCRAKMVMAVKTVLATLQSGSQYG
nr:hypothetical protein Iba_chr14bCG15770 [Ipomoea batatas]